LYSQVEAAGFKAFKPQGAYYILTDVAHWLPEYRCADDHEFALFLVKDIGVATVPGSSFYSTKELGRTKIRFCFPKTDDMLIEAGRRLQKLARCPSGSPPARSSTPRSPRETCAHWSLAHCVRCLRPRAAECSWWERARPRGPWPRRPRRLGAIASRPAWSR